MKNSIWICVILFSFGFKAQNSLFSSIGGGSDGQIYGFAFDSVPQKLYVSGSFIKLDGNFNGNGLAVWNGIKWDSLRHVLGDSVQRFQRIRNEIYGLGGKYLKKLDHTTGKWITISKIGNWGSITFITTFKNELVIIGIYDSINGQAIKNIARFDGINTNGFDNTSFFSQINSAVEFQNKLYICGSLLTNSNCGPLYRLAVWDGNCWQTLGNGIQGGFSSVSKLIVYKENLYVCGTFFKSEGNPGNCLISYDGANFNELGGGFSGNNGYILDMFVYKDKLILSGDSWSTIPNSTVTCPNFFSFDGQKFCTYFDYQPTNNPLGGIHIYKDTLIFIASSPSLGLTSVKGMAKYLGNLYNPLFCSSSVGLEAFNINLNSSVKIGPNPFSDFLRLEFIDGFDYPNSSIVITDMLGRVFVDQIIDNKIQTVDLRFLSLGSYILVLKGQNLSRSFKILKQ